MTVKNLIQQVEYLMGRQPERYMMQLINDALMDMSAKIQHHSLQKKQNLNQNLIKIASIECPVCLPNKKVLPEDEQVKVNKNNINSLLPKEEYIQVRKTFYLSMYTRRWCKQSIKKLLHLGKSLDAISIKDLEWLTKRNLTKDQSSIL